MSGRFRIDAASCPSTQSFPDIASHDANIVIPVVIGHRRYFASTPLLGNYRPAVGRAQPLLISVPNPVDLHGGLTMGVPNNPTGAGQVSKEGGSLNYRSSRLALVVLAKRARSLERGALASL